MRWFEVEKNKGLCYALMPLCLGPRLFPRQVVVTYKRPISTFRFVQMVPKFY